MNPALSRQLYPPRSPLALLGTWVSKVMMAVGVVVLSIEMLLVGCALVVTYAWLFRGPLTFHESWTPEERSYLTALDADLKAGHVEIIPFQEEEDWVSLLEGALSCVMREDEDGCWGLPAPLQALFEDVKLARFFAPRERILRQAAASGDARDCGSVAIIAATLGREDVMKLLIRRGASPTFVETDGRDVLSAWLTGDDCAESFARKMEVAEWLLQQGAVVRSDWRPYSTAICYREGGETLLKWLKSRGLSMEPSWTGSSWILPFNDLMTDAEQSPKVRLCLQEGWANLNDTRGYMTPLQKLILWSDGEEPSVRWLHEVLEWGADPNLKATPPPIPGTDEHSYVWEESPLRLLLAALLEEESPAAQEARLRMVDDMFQHGAKPEKCPIMDSPELEKKLEQIYRRHGYELELEPETSHP